VDEDRTMGNLQSVLVIDGMLTFNATVDSDDKHINLNSNRMIEVKILYKVDYKSSKETIILPYRYINDDTVCLFSFG